MYTPLTLLGSATYKYENGEVERVETPVILPKVLTNSDTSFPRIRYNSWFFYEIPEELRMKRVTLRATANITISGDVSQLRSCTVDVSPTIICNTFENIMGETLGGNVPPAAGRMVRTVGLQPVSYYAAGTYTQTNENYAYIGPGSVLEVRAFYTDRYDDRTVTLNSITAEILDDATDYIGIASTYPVNVNIKNSINQIFTWEKVMLSQWVETFDVISHSIAYKARGSSLVQRITVSDENYYQEVLAGTFSAGQYEYKIIMTTYYDTSIETDWNEFTSIGQDDAPTITGVSNENIPVVSWTDTNQDAFIVRVKNTKQEIIFDSGIIPGEAQTYKIPKMFENGTYIIEVKELNIYGYFSEWGSAEFTLDATEDNAPTEVFAFANNKYGIEIQGTPAVDAVKTYVVRREKGSKEVEVIGEYSGSLFIDYTTKGNVFYEYTLRNYNEGFKDGEWIPLQIKIKEIIIQDGRDLSKFVELFKTESANFAPNWTEEAERTLYNCLGRHYPIKEPGEWINSRRTFTAYVKEEKWPQLYEMALNAPKVYYKAQNEFFACDMQIEDAGRYAGGGRLVRFNLTRIDDKGTNIL